MQNKTCELQKNDFWDDEDVFARLSDNTELNGVEHSHLFIELIYVLSGTAMHTINNFTYSVKKGNVIIIDYNVPHTFTFDASDEEGFVTYNLLFTPDFFRTSSLDDDEFATLTGVYQFSTIFESFSNNTNPQNLIKTNSKEFRILFEKIYAEYIQNERGSQSVIRACLTEIIVKIFREVEKQPPLFIESHQELVEKAIEYMQKNFRSVINLDEIVSGIFLSKNYFRQIFKKTTGVSISVYIQRLRINEACHLLETSNYSSAEIAHQCGFNDTKFFYQTFKNLIGVTPAEYRREKYNNN